MLASDRVLSIVRTEPIDNYTYSKQMIYAELNR